MFLLLFIVAGTIIFSALGQLITYSIYGTLDPNTASNPAAHLRITQAIASIGAFLSPALLFAFCQDGKWFSYNDADKKPHYLLTNVVLILSITLLPVVAVIAQWNAAMQLPECFSGLEQWMRNMQDLMDDAMRKLTAQHTTQNLIGNLFVLGFLPALCEEFLFQGTVQAFLTKWSKKPHLAIWITAFIFSSIHFEFYGFVPRLLLGAYLGYLFFWSRSLWLPILAHFLHNALSIIIDYTMQGRGIMLDDIKFTDIHGAVPLTVSCALVSAMGLIFLWRTQKELNYSENQNK